MLATEELTSDVSIKINPKHPSEIKINFLIKLSAREFHTPPAEVTSAPSGFAKRKSCFPSHPQPEAVTLITKGTGPNCFPLSRDSLPPPSTSRGRGGPDKTANSPRRRSPPPSREDTNTDVLRNDPAGAAHPPVDPPGPALHPAGPHAVFRTELLGNQDGSAEQPGVRVSPRGLCSAPRLSPRPREKEADASPHSGTSGSRLPAHRAWRGARNSAALHAWGPSIRVSPTGSR